MMNDTLKLTDDQVLAHARDLLQEHLPLTADGSCCTTDDLLNVLLGIAVNREHAGGGLHRLGRLLLIRKPSGAI